MDLSIRLPIYTSTRNNTDTDTHIHTPSSESIYALLAENRTTESLWTTESGLNFEQEKDLAFRH